MPKALQKRQIPSALGTCLPCLLAKLAQGVSIIKLLSSVLLDEVRVKRYAIYEDLLVFLKLTYTAKRFMKSLSVGG